MKKILNFDTSKEIDENLPPSQDLIFKTLQCIPDDIFHEYTEVVENYINDLHILKNTLYSKENVNTFKYLTKDLDQIQLEKLNNIASDLASTEVLNKLRELSVSTFGFGTQTDESISQAQELFRMFESSNINFESEAERLALVSKDLKFLSEILFISAMGKNFEDLMFDRVSRTS